MQAPLTTAYRRQADRSNLATNANQIPNNNLHQGSLGDLLSRAIFVMQYFQLKMHLKMHKRCTMNIRRIFTKAGKQIFFL